MTPSILKSSALLGVATLALGVFGPAGAQPNTLSVLGDYAHDPSSYVDPDVVSADEALDRIERRDYGPYAYGDLLGRVTASASDAYVPALVAIAERFAEEDRERRAYAALSAARLLGMAAAEFERIAVETDGALAAAAILVLAQSPLAAELAELDARHTRVSSAAEALGNYRFVLSLQEEWDGLDGTAARVRLVLPHAIAGIGIWGFVPEDRPEAVWARTKLRHLAEETPGIVNAEVSAALTEYGFSDGLRERTLLLVETIETAPLHVVPPPRAEDPFSEINAAVATDGAVDATFSGNAFTVSGAPVGVDGAPVGALDSVHGITTSDALAADAVLAALSSQQSTRVTGLGSAPDVAVAPPPFDATAWAADLAAQATVTLDARPSGPVGTEAAPVVAHAPSGVRLGGGFRGTGVLVVDGAFEMRGDAEWRGLVVVRGSSDQQADPAITGSTRILGALLVLPGEGGGPASLRLAGAVSVLYSPEALALARAAAEQ